MRHKNKIRWFVMFIGLTSIKIVLENALPHNLGVHFLINLSVLAAYINVRSKEKYLFNFTNIYMLLAILDSMDLIAAGVTYPIVLFTGIRKEETVIRIATAARLLLYGLSMALAHRKRWYLPGTISVTAEGGILFTSAALEFGMGYMRLTDGVKRGSAADIILTAALISGIIILHLWIRDKKQEQKKLLELTEYAHRMREIFPAVARILDRIEGNRSAGERESIEELKELCRQDREQKSRKARCLRCFCPTGSSVLDALLEEYLCDAEEKGIDMDIIVRAGIGEVLRNEKIILHDILSIVGDLVRNACNAVGGVKNGRILICFGYNPKGVYEISVYDNGEEFSPYVLRRLGERGVTTGGSGHGLADIFESIKTCRASFVLRKKRSENSVFEKGVCIVFDRKGRIEIEKQ